MRIGFDALCVDNQSGSGIYARELLLALSRQDSTNEYHVFLPDNPANCGLDNLSSNFCTHIAHTAKRFIRPLWVQTILPLRTRKLDLLHVPQFAAPVWGKAPLVVTIHDVAYEVFPETIPILRRKFYRTVVPRAAQRAAKIIADSDGSKREISEILDVQPEKIATIPLGVSQDFFERQPDERIASLRREYGLTGKYVLTVGTLEPRKNLPTLLRAFANLRQQGWTAKLAIVGRPGWDYRQILTLAESEALAGAVVFLGFVPRSDLPAIYQTALAFAFPSLHEGFGLPLLEAMASGIPVISSGIDSALELLKEEGTGLMVEAKDVRGWTDAIEDVLKDSELARHLGTHAKQAARKYTWDITARKTIQVYESVSGKSSKGKSGGRNEQSQRTRRRIRNR